MAFFFPYMGGKGRELKHLARLELPEYDVVVEPFAGSAAVARGLGRAAVIGDDDPNLMRFYDSVAAGGWPACLAALAERLAGTPAEWRLARKQLLEKRKKRLPMEPAEYYIGQLFAANSMYLRELEHARERLRNVQERDYAPAIAFVSGARRLCGDWRDTVKDYEQNERALVFLDPPYFSSANSEYYGYQKRDGDGLTDFSQVYVDIRDLMRRARCSVVMIVNDVAILRALFADLVRADWGKTYGSRNKARHMLVSNRPLRA